MKQAKPETIFIIVSEPKAPKQPEGLQDRSGFLDLFGWITIVIFGYILVRALFR